MSNKRRSLTDARQAARAAKSDGLRPVWDQDFAANRRAAGMHHGGMRSDSGTGVSATGDESATERTRRLEYLARVVGRTVRAMRAGVTAADVGAGIVTGGRT